MRILEATIAVTIISTVLIFVYSNRVGFEIIPSEYIYDLQRDILTDISSNSSLRLSVLNTAIAGDAHSVRLDGFVESRITSLLDYSVEVCGLTDPLTPCKLNDDDYLATRLKDVFVEEIIVSSDLGEGASAVYNPKKLRLFIWVK